MRYIDADKMIEDTIAMKQLSEAIMIDGIIDYVKEHSEEAEIVKHGQWIKAGVADRLYKCSCCNTPKLLQIYAPTNSIHMPKYCEECGAKMDKEEKEK